MTDRKLFVEAARSGAGIGGMTLETVARAMPSEAPADSRTIPFVLSDETVDRMGDRILVAGWDLTEIRRNPIALWAHDSSQPPIGKLSNIRTSASARLLGDVEFAPAAVSSFADKIYRMVKGGYLSAGSVGFRPIKYSFSRDPARPQGIDFERQELLEFSVVPVPANANALAVARSLGIDLPPIDAVAARVAATKAWLAEQARQRRIAEAERLIAGLRR